MARDTRPLSERLDQAMDDLADIPREARKGARRVSNAMEGFRIDTKYNPDAPERNDYESYAEYAIDAHDWAREQLAERQARLADVASGIDESEYPPLGHDRPDDRETREQLDDDVVAVAEVLGEVQEAREWLDRLEEDYRDR